MWGTRKLARALEGRGAQLGVAQQRGVDLLGAVEAVDAVALLEDVRELRVAVAEHVRVGEQHAGEPDEPLHELLGAARPFAVAPRLVARLARHLGGGPRVPPDAAELAAEVRLPGVRHGPGTT